MKQISSKDNLTVKTVASLAEKKYRDELGLFLLEGPNPVRELMDFGGRPRFIFIRAGASEEILSLAEKCPRSAAVYELSEEAFSKIASTPNPQGIIAVAEKRQYSEDEFFSRVGEGNVLVLDRLQDPGNVGTLIRSAEAMGFGGIIFVKGCADPYQPKTVRAAVGSIIRMPVLFTESGEKTADILKKHGKNVFAACMQGELSIDRAELKANAAIVIGNEGNGISEEILESEGVRRIFIPMEGKSESLNAAVAACIIMYESKRQRS